MCGGQLTASELRNSAEKKKDGKNAIDNMLYELFEEEKEQPVSAEERQKQFHDGMMRSIFMQQLVMSTLVPRKA